MNFKDAKELADLQDTRLEIEARIYCPMCESEKKSLVLKLAHDRAYCYECKRDWPKSKIGDLRMMIQDNKLEEKDEISKMMTGKYK